MSLEQAIAYIQDDELVEVTPKAIRIRKRFLDPHERKRDVEEAGSRLMLPISSEPALCRILVDPGAGGGLTAA